MNNTIFKRALAALLASCLWLCVSASVGAQQGGTTRYIYDSNGRLRVVISPVGEAVVYEYDAAGNVRAVRRLAADALGIFAFSPSEGSAGDLIEVIGSGFGQGVSGVTFNGVAARVVETSASRLVAEVPEGATTGPIGVTTPTASTVTVEPFTVFARVRVTPSPARVLPNDQQQFTALVSSLEGDRGVVWSVNGVVGGNAAGGTITQGGLYAAPAKQTGAIIVRATSVIDPELFGESEVTLRVNVQAVGTPLVSVSRSASPGSRPVTPPVSVRRGDPLGLNTPMSEGISVKYGSLTASDRAYSPAVSVRRGSITGQAVETAAPVSVRNGGDPGRDRTTSAFVSVNTGPHVAAVTPSAARRGTTFTLTLIGQNLEGATALRFINESGALDAGFTVTDISVSADGTTLTATVAVSSAAATGRRVVSVTTPAGVTLREDLGFNAIQINP